MYNGCVLCCAQFLSFAQLFAHPWTVALQATLSMGFPRHEYWSGLQFPSPLHSDDFKYSPHHSDCTFPLYFLSSRENVIMCFTRKSGANSQEAKLTFLTKSIKLILHLLLFSFSIFYNLRDPPTPVLLPGKSHGRRSLEGCSPWGR